MKRVLTSASLIAMGAVGVQAAYAPGLTPQQTSKPWSVSATLRGFYDDNPMTLPSGAEDESWGVEVSPAAALNWSLDQTYVGLSYVYGMRWFEGRTEDKVDQSHEVNAKLSHAFSERYKLDLSDTFRVAQEPAVDLNEGAGTFLRTEADRISNIAEGSLSIAMTEQLSTVIGYANRFFDYDQDGIGSRSSLLDRVENAVSANLRWQALPETVGILGYQYEIVQHTSEDELINPAAFAGSGLTARQVADLTDPEVRDTESHYVYVGVDQSFTPTLTGSLRVGAQFVQFDDDAAKDDTVNPYVDGSATWTYNPGSYAQLGVRHSRTESDLGYLAGAFQVDPSLDAETTTIYGSLNHRITAKLVGSLLGQFLISEYEGGFADNETDNFLLLGANLTYEINQFLAAEVGYNYDRLDSDLANRSYTRNRIYVGLRATY